MMEAVSPEEILEAIYVLDRGGFIVMPTDTVYGLAAAADNSGAIRKIYAAKGRDPGKPLAIMVADRNAALRLVEFPPAARRLAGAFWPGPLTLVLRWQVGFGISRAVAAGQPTLGLRVPDHPLARGLLRAYGRPLAVTSANRSGAPVASEVDDIDPEILEAAGLILDAGPTPVGIESTVVEVTDGRIRLLRRGALEAGALAAELGIEADEISS